MRVKRSVASPAPFDPAPALLLQRKCACGRSHADGGECEECRRSAGRGRAPAVSEILGEPGRPLDPATRQAMETRFRHDFSGVRVHDDSRAARSAEAVGARAYTVGSHIVFGSGGGDRGSLAGQRLLAHELAHVVQQGQRRHAATAADSADMGRTEREADATEHAVAGGGPMPALTPVAPGVARDEAPGAAPSNAAVRADVAEAVCDITTLCNLSITAPSVVNQARIRRVFAACHPEVSPVRLVGGNPCLTPNWGLPTPAGPAAPKPEGPARAPGVGVGPQATQAGGSGGGPKAGSGGVSLPSTTINFNLGPAAFTVDLPTSLAMKLPIEFRGKSVVIALSASPSEFSLTVTLNAIPHVRVIAGAKATPKGEGSAGLTIETTRKTCHAMDALTARQTLQSAGEKLRDAILAVQNPPPLAADASDIEKTYDLEIRLGKVAAAVADVNSAIDKVKAGCKEVPVATFQFGVQGPLTAPTPGTQPSPSFLGGSLRFHF
jgi:hypothetical protein